MKTPLEALSVASSLFMKACDIREEYYWYSSYPKSRSKNETEEMHYGKTWISSLMSHAFINNELATESASKGIFILVLGSTTKYCLSKSQLKYL